MKEINEEMLNEAFSIAAKCEAKTWLDLKKIMLLSLPPKSRTHFSTRNPRTKKQTLNDFEREVIDIYYKKTGVMVRLPNDE